MSVKMIYIAPINISLYHWRRNKNKHIFLFDTVAKLKQNPILALLYRPLTLLSGIMNQGDSIKNKNYSVKNTVVDKKIK